MADPDVVNVTRLIALVRERPVLWDRTLTELYKNRKLTQRAWAEICSTLLADYPALAEADRKAAERNMMGKWANLRDNWLRYWRKLQDLMRTGAPPDSLRKYIHHDRMIFLSKVYDTEAWGEVEQIEVEVDLPSPASLSPSSEPWGLSDGAVTAEEFMEWKKLAPNLIYRSTNVNDSPEIAQHTVTNENVKQLLRNKGEICNNSAPNNVSTRAADVSEESSAPLTRSDLSDMRLLVSQLQRVSDRLAAEDSHDLFGRHVAALLRELPAARVDSLKRKILKSIHHAKEDQGLEHSQSLCSDSPSSLPSSQALNSHVEVTDPQPVISKRRKRKNQNKNELDILLPSPGSRRKIKKLKPYDV